MDDIDSSLFLKTLSSNDVDDNFQGLLTLLELFDSEDSTLNKLPFSQIYNSLVLILCKQQNEDILNNTTLCIVKSDRFIQANANSQIVQNPTQILQSIFNHLANPSFKKITKIHILNALFHIILHCQNQSTIFDFSKFPLLDTVKQYFDNFDKQIEISFIRMLNSLWSFYGQFKHLYEYRDSLFNSIKCLDFLFYLKSKKGLSIITTQLINQLIINIMFAYNLFTENENCLLLLIEQSQSAEKAEITNFIQLLNTYLSSFEKVKKNIISGQQKLDLSELIKPSQTAQFIEIILTFSFSFIPKPPLPFIDELFDNQLFQWDTSQPINESYVAKQSAQMIKSILKVYHNNRKCKLILLKSLAVYGFYCQIDPSETILYNLAFDAKEQEYSFYIALIISNLEENKRKIIFRTGIFNTLQIHQFESETVNDYYADFLDNKLQYEEVVLPDEVLSPESLNDIVSSIQKGELLFFDFLSDSNDLFNICWDLLPTSNKEDLIVFVDFIFNKGLSLLNLPESPKDPFPTTDYSELLYKSIPLLLHGKSKVNVELYAPILYTEVLINKDRQSEIETEFLSNQEIAKIFQDFDQVFTRVYSMAVIAQELNVKGFTHYVYEVDGQIIDPFLFFVKSILDISDDTENFFRTRKLNVYPIISLRPESNYLHKTKERMNKNDPIEGINQFEQNLFELLNEIYLQDPSINLINDNFVKRIIHQLSSPILTIGVLTPCTKLMIKYPFLFSFEDRFFFFKVLTSELAIVANLYSLRFKKEHLDNKPTHIWHMKVSRDNLFDEGNRILKRFGKYKIFLEFSFDGETGVGTGPNREFFSLMSKEFCLKKRGMWRTNSATNDSFAFTDKGLFPVCTANDEDFYNLGIFVAKAIQMDIMIDIPFNPSFFDLIFGRKVELEDIDTQYSISLSDPSNLYGLYFIYPVNEKNQEIEMIENGQNIEVNESNANEYIKLFKEYTFGKMIKSKIDAFVNGFSQILDIETLNFFTSNEINRIICGDGFNLTKKILQDNVRIGYGFGPNSEQINFLFDIILEMDHNERNLFFQFITGSSRLPVGGLAAIHPPLTIARRVTDNPLITDDDPLPTVLTCTHYFKLPAYSTKAIMKEKLMKAVMEGRENFTQT